MNANGISKLYFNNISEKYQTIFSIRFYLEMKNIVNYREASFFIVYSTKIKIRWFV